MKVLYVESKIRNSEEFIIPEEEISKLPKKLFLAYSVQYKDIAIRVKRQLEEKKIVITNYQQVLGCSKISTKSPVLLIGSGRFHSINLFLQAPEVWIFEDRKIIRISNKEIEELRIQKKTALIKYLKAEKIGIIVSSKPGQENLLVAEKLKARLEKKGKKPYLFLSNNIDISQLENYNMDFWVNTACPGIFYDSNNIINYSDIPKF